jgi:hypothetical protein
VHALTILKLVQVAVALSTLGVAGLFFHDLLVGGAGKPKLIAEAVGFVVLWLFTMALSISPPPPPPVKMATQRVETEGVTYDFPAEDIEAYTSRSEGTLFVILAPQGEHFHLIIDELTNNVRNKQGADVPTISRLNSNRFEHFNVYATPEGKVICGGRMPYFNCGLQVLDGGVKWSILFDKAYLSNASEIRAKATALINSYRAK